jgi:hypothetical protein
MSRQRSQYDVLSHKIKYKAVLALVRMALLYAVYIIDNNSFTPFIKDLVSYLLIHEALVISNYALLTSYSIINRFMSNYNIINSQPSKNKLNKN